MNNIVQYFVINKELDMSPGKVAAQVAHVATISAVDLVNPSSNQFTGYQDYFHEWFNTDMKKITLKGKENDLKKLIDKGFYHIRDNGLTEIPEGSLTVVGLPPMPKEEAQQFVKRLRLY